MPIAYILGSFPVLSESFIRNEIAGLQQAGQSIYVVAFDRTDCVGEDDFPINASYVQNLPIPSLYDVISLLYRSLFALPFIARQKALPRRSLIYQSMRLALHLRAKGCTHIHTHFAWGNAAHAIVAAKLLKLPVTMTCHGSDVYATPQDIEVKCQHVDTVIAVCDDLANEIRRHTKTPVQVIECGVDTESFNVAETQHDRLLFVGRLIDCKGVNDLLHALSALPEESRPQLDIVGDGALRDELERLSRSLGLQKQVCFLGAKSSEWIRQHGPHYRAFVSAFREGRDGAKDTGPVAVKEAMAMGLPVLTTRFMGLKQMVDTSYGWLVEPEDRHALAQCFFQIQEMHNKDLLKMRRNARLSALQKYRLDAQIQSLDGLFEQLAQPMPDKPLRMPFNGGLPCAPHSS